jgi:excisionase family DNA binding protein
MIMFPQANNVVTPSELKMFSVRKTAEILGIGRTKLYQLLDAGKLQRVKVGRKVLIPHKSIAGFLSDLGV